MIDGGRQQLVIICRDILQYAQLFVFAALEPATAVRFDVSGSNKEGRHALTSIISVDHSARATAALSQIKLVTSAPSAPNRQCLATPEALIKLCSTS